VIHSVKRFRLNLYDADCSNSRTAHLCHSHELRHGWREVELSLIRIKQKLFLGGDFHNLTYTWYGTTRSLALACSTPSTTMGKAWFSPSWKVALLASIAVNFCSAQNAVCLDGHIYEFHTTLGVNWAQASKYANTLSRCGKTVRDELGFERGYVSSRFQDWEIAQAAKGRFMPTSRNLFGAQI
jgi:hypothetical protein